jgi:hypothetical protein
MMGAVFWPATEFSEEFSEEVVLAASSLAGTVVSGMVGCADECKKGTGLDAADGKGTAVDTSVWRCGVCVFTADAFDAAIFEAPECLVDWDALSG